MISDTERLTDMKQFLNVIMTIAGIALICFYITVIAGIFIILSKVDCFLTPITDWLRYNPIAVVIAGVMLTVLNIVLTKWHKSIRRNGKKSDWSF